MPTSPPPAIIPFERYWNHPGNQQNAFATNAPETGTNTVVSTAPTSTTLSQHVDNGIEKRSRLMAALSQLFEMGFWNQSLNEELLEKNQYDVNTTIEDLLSPERNQSQAGTGNSGVILRQPHYRESNCIDFD